MPETSKDFCGIDKIATFMCYIANNDSVYGGTGYV